MCKINVPQELMDMVSAGEQAKPQGTFYDFHEHTYSIVSRVAYLIGVPRKIFDNENEAPRREVYDQLEKDRNAHIVRSLCMLRTAIERNYSEIYKQMRFDLKNLHTLPELVPQECINYLAGQGMDIIRMNYQPIKYIIDLNKLISNHINNCSRLFPTWLEWKYIRELFIMPNGSSENGAKQAAEEYYANKSGCPYGVYINWPYSNSGNILFNDKKFVQLLYEANEDCFTDLSKVSDAGLKTKDSIYDFIERSEKTAIIVDCENSDPYKLYAMLNNLDSEALLSHICKIILYNDVHTATAWKIIEDFTDIPVEHNMIQRLKESKSLADVMLTAGTCREHYINGTDSFILASSDSDFWGLIKMMPELDFLVLVESRKCGPDIKLALENGGFTYCYLDNFCTGNSNEIKVSAVLGEIEGAISGFTFNIREIFDRAHTATRANMSAAEQKQFYDRYLRKMKLAIEDDGKVYIKLGE